MRQVKYFNAVLVICGCLASASLLAADFKIGLVDKEVLSHDSLYAKNVHERMKKEFSARQDALIAKEKDLMTKYEALERDKDVIAEAEKSKREKELVKLQQQLKDESEAFQSDVMARQEKESAAFQKLVTDTLAQIAKEEKLDLVMQQQVALYSADKNDYTQKVLQVLDKLYKDSHKK